MKFENTIIINRSVEEVFAYLTQLEHLPDWNYAISHTIKITPDSVGVGTRYSQERTLPRHMTEALEITAFEPPQLLSISGGFGLLPQGTSTYRLTKIDESKTLLQNEMMLEVKGMLQLVAPIGSIKVKAAVAQNLAVLKRILEKK